MKVKSLSRVQLVATPWTAACQAPLSMGFSRQEYWSGVPLPSPTKSVKVAIFSSSDLEEQKNNGTRQKEILSIHANFPSWELTALSCKELY